MAEYVCLQAHCGECNHICVKSPFFYKMLEEGKVNKSELALDGLIHKFDKYNQIFILTGELCGVFLQSDDEMIKMFSGLED